MKTFKRIALYSLLAAFGAAFFTSCSTSNDVVNNSLIQKRKYRSGFYVSKKSEKQDPTVTVERTDLALEKTLADPQVAQVSQSKTKFKVIEKAVERRVTKQAKIQDRESKNSTQEQRDVRRTQADFTTGIATASLVQRRAMDENLKMAIIFAAISTGVSIIASVLYSITGVAIIYYLLILAALACFAYAVYRLVLFFMEL